MRKVFPIFAVLMATMLAIWMVGCGGEEECTDVVTLKATEPPDGGDLFANGTLTITFEGTPDAGSVTVNDGETKGGGSKYTWAATGLTAGQQATLTIKWTYCAGAKSDEASVTVNVKEKDTVPPAIADSSPKDGAKDLDPEKLKADGITVTFSEPVTVKSGNVYFQVGDEKISWLVEPSDDKTSIKLTHKGTADLPYESEIVLKMDKVTDGAGNKADLSITFNTKAKE